MTPQQTFLLARDVQSYLGPIILFGSLFLLVRSGSWALRLVPALITLVGFGVLAFVMWGFGDVSANQPETLIPLSAKGIHPETGTLWMLIFDLVIVTLLVALSGGSERSCFSPLYFMLPTFTLLLLNFGWPLIIYSGLVIVSFGLTLFGNPADRFFRPKGWEDEDPGLIRWSRIALWIISGICLAMALYIDFRRHEPQPKQTAAAEVKALAEHPQPTPLPALTLRYEPTKKLPAPTATPLSTPAQIATPTPIAAPPKAATYSEFLDQWKGLHRKKESAQRRILTGYIGEHVSWSVEFQRSEPRRGETQVFFSEIASTNSGQNRPVKFAKVSAQYKRFVQRLHKGARIRIEGDLRRHSSTELFVRASAITLLDDKDRGPEHQH